MREAEVAIETDIDDVAWQDPLTPHGESTLGDWPSEWSVVRLSDVLDFRNGVNADKASYGHGVRFINVLEPITYSHLTSSDIPGRVSLQEPLIRSYQVRRGDLVFNRTSETQEEVGLAAVYLDDEKVVFGGFVIRGRFRAQVLDPVYSGYALRAPAVRLQLVAKGQGAIRANIGQSELGQVQVPIPPLPEQRAIADALSDVDNLIAALNALIAKERAIKLATMQQLLTGRMRLPGFEGAWETKKISDIAEIDPENLAANTDPDFQFNYISLEQVDVGKLKGFTEERFATAPSRARRKLRIGDLLVSTVRPNLQSHLHFTGQVANAVCSTGFAVVRVGPQLADPKFVFGYIFSDTVSKQIDRLIGGSNYPAITSRDVANLEIGLPCLVEQQAIGSLIADMDAEIEALEARVAKTRDIKEGMMQQLLTGRIRLVTPAPEEVTK